MQAVYAHRDFAAAFGDDLSTLKSQWLERLRDRERTPIAEADLTWARSRVDRKPILQRVCPLVTASLLREASQAMRDDDAGRALAALDEAIQHRGGEPRIRLRRIHARAGMERWEEVAEEAASLENSPDASLAIQLATRERRGDAQWATGQRARAAGLYSAIAEETVIPATRRRLALKLALVRRGPDPLETELRGLLLQGGKLADRLETLDSLTEAGRESPLLDYLRGRHLHALRRPEEAVPTLRAALQAGLPHPLLTRAAHRDLGTRLWLLGRWERASVHFHAARALTPSDERGARAQLADWIDRCEWSSERGAHANALPPRERQDGTLQDWGWSASLTAEWGIPPGELDDAAERSVFSRSSPRPCAGDPPFGRRCCGG